MSALDRTLLGAFAIFTAAIGVFLLAAPQAFYTNVTGVGATGSFNDHFFRDVGLAYITLAAGAAFALFRPEYALPVAAMAALYLVGHAVLHVFLEGREVASGNGATALAEAPGIYLLAALAVALVVRAASAARRGRLRKNSGEA